MSAGKMMLLGAFVASIGLFADVVGFHGVGMLSFAGGALFGKGYGIWEAAP